MWLPWQHCLSSGIGISSSFGTSQVLWELLSSFLSSTMAWIFILIRWSLLQLLLLPVHNPRQTLSVLCALEQPNTMRSHLFPSSPVLMVAALNYTSITIPWTVMLCHRPCANSLSLARFSFVYPLSFLFHCLSPVCSAKSTAQKVPPYNFLFTIALH